MIERDGKQPPPLPGKQVVADLVEKDFHDLVEFGRMKYGTKLMTFNGRDALQDVYQELWDSLFYIRQLIAERDNAENHTLLELALIEENCRLRDRQQEYARLLYGQWGVDELNKLQEMSQEDFDPDWERDGE